MIRPHHQQLLLACNENHVATDGLAKGALDEEALGEAIEMDDLLVVYIGKLVDWEKSLLGVEGEVASIVVREVECSIPVAHNENLKKAQDRLCIAVSSIVLVIDDLLDRAAGAYAEGLELDLNDRHAVDQQNYVITMMAVVRIYPQLTDHLKRIFAPVLYIYEGVVEWRAIIAREIVPLAQGSSCREYIRRHDLV